MNATNQARKTATTDDEPDEYRIHDTDEEYVTVACTDCVWTNTNPPLRANDFADAHEDRHGHEVSQ